MAAPSETPSFGEHCAAKKDMDGKLKSLAEIFREKTGDAAAEMVLAYGHMITTRAFALVSGLQLVLCSHVTLPYISVFKSIEERSEATMRLES